MLPKIKTQVFKTFVEIKAISFAYVPVDFQDIAFLS